MKHMLEDLSMTTPCGLLWAMEIMENEGQVPMRRNPITKTDENMGQEATGGVSLAE